MIHLGCIFLPIDNLTNCSKPLLLKGYRVYAKYLSGKKVRALKINHLNNISIMQEKLNIFNEFQPNPTTSRFKAKTVDKKLITIEKKSRGCIEFFITLASVLKRTVKVNMRVPPIPFAVLQNFYNFAFKLG